MMEITIGEETFEVPERVAEAMLTLLKEMYP